MSGSEALVAVWLIIATSLVIILRGPLGKAIARRLEGRQAGHEDAPAVYEELRHQAMDNEALAGRVAELEERLDFAERLLARDREQAAGHLAAGDGP